MSPPDQARRFSPANVSRLLREHGFGPPREPADLQDWPAIALKPPSTLARRPWRFRTASRCRTKRSWCATRAAW